MNFLGTVKLTPLSSSLKINCSILLLFVGLKSAVSITCSETRVTAVVHTEEMRNWTVVELSIKDCPRSDFNVTGNKVTTTYDRCAKNVTQDNEYINQVSNTNAFVASRA